MGLRANGYVTFDQQVIFEYLLSNNDSAITAGTDEIIERGTSEGVASLRVPLMLGKVNTTKNRSEIMGTAAKITGSFRLYLRGHGDWYMQTLGGRTAIEVVSDVLALGEKLDLCKVISITGCELAKTSGQSTSSFAKTFHYRLSKKEIPVFAREETVTVLTSENVEARRGMHAFAKQQGVDIRLVKTGSKDDASRASKKLFYWLGKTQMMIDADCAEDFVLAEFMDEG